MARFEATANLDVRSGPGIEFEKLDELQKGDVIEEVVAADWWPISMTDGSIGWVSRKYLTSAKEVPSAAPTTQKKGQDLIDLAITRIGEKYVYGANVSLNDLDWHGPWDCAEFVTWVVKQVTGKTYGCIDNSDIVDPDPYTGGWKSDVIRGTVINLPIAQAFKTLGAILLRYREGEKHIVFSDGKGGTVEAMGAAYGVCRGKVGSKSNWDYGILIPNMAYITL